MTKVTETKALSVWDEKQTAIQETFGKNLSKNEFTMFMEMGRALQLNPFNREIWAVKYGTNVSIFVGRDGYRINAQRQEDYNGHEKAAIYENDTFEVKDGRIHHKFNLKNRGRIIGAWCEVYRKGIDHPFREIVNFDEYYKGHKNPDGSIKKRYNSYSKQWEDMKPTNWDTMEATMIQKVAEAQALRMAYQGIFAGTYDESENWKVESEASKPTGKENKPSVQGTNRAQVSSPNINPQDVEDATVIDKTPQTPEEKATAAFTSRMEQIKQVIIDRSGNEQIFLNALGAAGYVSISEITQSKARKDIYKTVYDLADGLTPKNTPPKDDQKGQNNG